MSEDSFPPDTPEQAASAKREGETQVLEGDPIPRPENVDLPVGDRTPPQLAPDPTSGLVNIVALASDEFGISRSQIRQMIASGRVEVGGASRGVVYELPYDDVKGQHIAINGDVQSVHFFYRG